MEDLPQGMSLRIRPAGRVHHEALVGTGICGDGWPPGGVCVHNDLCIDLSALYRLRSQWSQPVRRYEPCRLNTGPF
jgi:hypothetical protein